MAETKQITLKINDRALTVPAGTLVIEAGRRMGVEVPSFCYYPGLSLQAACRMCLVEVAKAPKLQAACTLVAVEGMEVKTDTPQVHEARKAMLEFLLTNHPLDCPVCDKGGECELQDMVFRYGADGSRFVEEKIHHPEEKWSELVYFDAPRCILCFRCVRVCDEGMDVKALGVGARGVHSAIIPNMGDHLECEECGMCIDICPVGALTSGTYRYKTRPWEMEYVGTACAHCSNGCKTTLSVRNNEVMRANNRDLSGINGDFLCVKGRFGFDFTKHPERLKEPLVRRNGKLQPASWEEALGVVAERMKQVRDAHGPETIGFIGSNRTTNEESYLLQRIARTQIGTNHVDHHQTADYKGLAAALGTEASVRMGRIADLGRAPAILLIGNDPTEQNPLVAWRIREAVRHIGARVYIVHSCQIKLTRQAKQFVRVAKEREYEAVQWLATGAGNAGGAREELEALKNALANEKDVVVIFGDEIQGDDVLHLVKFGNALAGTTKYIALGDYVNSRGAADMGVLPLLLPGYERIEDAAARGRFEKLWGAGIPAKPGISAPEMVTSASVGKIKALYVVGANPAMTFLRGKAHRFPDLELLVVQEMFLTETAERADVVLPATCVYEKDGTVTNTAGEVQRTRKALAPVGPRSDFDLLRFVSHALAMAGMGNAVHVRTAEAVFEEIRTNVRGYDVVLGNLIAGGAEASSPWHERNGKPHEIALSAAFSSRDTLFTSGTLGRYCTMMNSVEEAAAK